MKEYAEQFYKSKQWQKCRAAYIKSVGGLCERCFAEGRFNAGVIVHHKIHINPDNITNPAITLDWNNLQLLCKQCHNEIHESDMHKRKRILRYTIGDNGCVMVEATKTP